VCAANCGDAAVATTKPAAAVCARANVKSVCWRLWASRASVAGRIETVATMLERVSNPMLRMTLPLHSFTAVLPTRIRQRHSAGGVSARIWSVRQGAIDAA